MDFSTQTEAKKFFADKIILEACHLGTPLSESQRYMLLWSESDPDFKDIPEMNRAFEEETSEVDYENMVCNLIKNAYDRDMQTDKTMRDDWRRAYDVLKKGDHYILAMLNDAVGKALVPWWKLGF